MEEKKGWDYGKNLPPDRWNELPGFEGGKLPSPIGLSRARAEDNSALGKIVPDYRDDEAVVRAMKGFFFENLHFEIEIEEGFDAGGVLIGGRRLKLEKLHFHIPGEHTIDSKDPLDMEVHLVHEPEEEGSRNTVITLVVKGLTPELEKLGAKASPLVQFFVTQLPKLTVPIAESRRAKAEPKSLNEGFPDRKSYFRYVGGLTTPPCGEPVTFYVLDTPIYTTPSIIRRFGDYVPGGNNRPLQPDNDRLVEYFKDEE